MTKLSGIIPQRVTDPPLRVPRPGPRRGAGAPGRGCPRNISEDRLSDHFLDRREAVLDLCQAGAAEGDHPFLDPLPLDLQGRGAGEDHLLDLLRDLQDLHEGDATLQAGPVAALAALALHDLNRLRLFRGEAELDQDLGRDVGRDLAVRADPADQALGGDEDDRRGDEVRLDAHVHEPVDRRGSVVRVERGEDEVARQGGLHGDLGRFEVADLADEDDVRVLPQEGPEGRGEIQSDRVLHLHLVHAGQVELDRVLGRHDVRVGGVDPREGGVEGVRLPRPRGPGYQDHSPRAEDRLLELLEARPFEAQLRHVEHQVVLVEKPADDLLAEEGRQDADAVVELLHLRGELHLDLDAPVLREAFLGDVELGEDLDARRDRFLELARRVHHLRQHAVHPVADPVLLLVGLDVDVGGAALDGVRQDDVDEPDDGSLFPFLDELLEVDGVLLFLVHDLERGVGGVDGRHLLHDLLQLEGVRGAVVPVDRVLEGDLGSDDRLDVVAGHELQVVHREDVRRVGHRDGERRARLVDRQDVVLARDVRRDQLQDVRVDLEVRQVDRRDAELRRQRLRDVVFGDEAEPHERLTQLHPRVLLLLERQRELLGVDELRLEEKFSQFDRHGRNDSRSSARWRAPVSAGGGSRSRGGEAGPALRR